MLGFGGSPNGGIGGAIGAGGPLTPQGIFQLMRLLGSRRRTQDLVPGTSFPGYDPQGNPMDTEDPYKYANFSMPQAQTPGINPGARTPNAGGIPGAGAPGGGIGSRVGGFLRQNAGQLIGAGAQLIGSKMASNQMGKANQVAEQNSQRSYELALEEKRRRDMLIRMLMPQILRDMGVNDQQKAQQMIGQFGG